MIESESAAQKEKAEFSGIYTNTSQSGPDYRRELSFSRWCVEDVVISPKQACGNGDSATSDEPEFELHLLPDRPFKFNSSAMDRCEDHSEVKQRGSPMQGGNWANINGHGFESFDIETNVLERGGSNSSGDDRPSFKDSKNTVPVADVLRTLFFILVWYTFSTFLTLYNKTLLGDDLGKFPAPLLMNTVHFAMQAILSKAITWFWLQRSLPGVTMSWWDYFEKVVPTALGTALDINLSNASLVFISVTFATMCKSASPIFLLLFAFAFRLESPSIKLFGIILIISSGILLTVAKETAFDFWGFIFVMLASVMSGFRWSMTQILLQKEAYGLKNPLTLMSYVTPIMAFATAVLSLFLDPWHEFKMNSYFNSSWHVTRSILLMLFGGTLAFFMVLTEFILVSATSAVTVTIAGVVKEAVTILVAVLYFHDKFTWSKGAGLFVIIIGVSLFNWYKYQKLQEAQDVEDDMNTSGAPKYVIVGEDDPEDDTTA